MIDMHAHPDRMMFGKNRAELRRDSLRQENWNAGADSEKLDVFDRAQPRQQLVDLVVGKNQRVATAQEHVAHLGVLFEITKSFFEIRMKFLFADAADHAASRAIPAIR